MIEIDFKHDVAKLDVWTDSDWTGDTDHRNMCSGGDLHLRTATVHHWSKLHAWLCRAVRRNLAVSGVRMVMQEIFGEKVNIRLTWMQVRGRACCFDEVLAK